MAIVRPLAALRPPKDRAAKVASVPYDVVNSAEARSLAAGNADSFLHVVKPEIDLPEGTDLYSDAVYDQGKRGLELLQESGALVRDSEEALYIYRQIMNGHAQFGVVGRCSVDEYDNDLIKKHEKTRPDKEDDRTRHVTTMRAHAGPVFLTYRGLESIDAIVAKAIEDAPLYDFEAVDSVQHTVWRLAGDAANQLSEAFKAVPATYVADGHHRSASASRARAACRDANPEHTGDEPYNFFLTVLFPADQLKILPYNRFVHSLAGKSEAEFLEALSGIMTVTKDAKPEPKARGHFSMYLGGQWYGLEAPAEVVNQADPVASLDAAILQSLVLEPLLGIEDPRTSHDISFVGGIRGTQELEKLANERKGSVAFSLFALSTDQLLAVADQNRVLPPKSTWFEPKLRSGLIVNTF